MRSVALAMLTALGCGGSAPPAGSTATATAIMHVPAAAPEPSTPAPAAPTAAAPTAAAPTAVAPTAAAPTTPAVTAPTVASARPRPKFDCSANVWGGEDAYEVIGVVIPFCTSESAPRARPVADGAPGPMAAPPFDRCPVTARAPSTNKRRDGRFDADATAKDREKAPWARRCCYAACSLD